MPGALLLEHVLEHLLEQPDNWVVLISDYHLRHFQTQTVKSQFVLEPGHACRMIKGDVNHFIIPHTAKTIIRCARIAFVIASVLLNFK